MAKKTKQATPRADSNPLDLLSTIKDTVAFLGGVAAIGYVAGFIIVSTNLLRWGISDLSLLQARYVSVGLFFIIAILFTSAPAVCSYWVVEKVLRYLDKKLAPHREVSTANKSSAKPPPVTKSVQEPKPTVSEPVKPLPTEPSLGKLTGLMSLDDLIKSSEASKQGDKAPGAVLSASSPSKLSTPVAGKGLVAELLSGATTPQHKDYLGKTVTLPQQNFALTPYYTNSPWDIIRQNIGWIVPVVLGGSGALSSIATAAAILVASLGAVASFLGLAVVFANSIFSLLFISITSTSAWLGQRAPGSSANGLLPDVQALTNLFDSLKASWFVPTFLVWALLFIIARLKGNILSLFLAAPTLIGLVIAMRTFIFDIYPRVTPALGGGDTVEIRLVAGKDADTLRELVPLETTSKTIPLRLLDQNDRVYFVLVPDSPGNRYHAVQIDKSLVQGVIYTPGP